MTHPKWEILQNPIGKLVKLSLPNGYWESYQYDADDKFVKLTTIDGRWEVHRYDFLGKLIEIKFSNGFNFLWELIDDKYEVVFADYL